MDCKQRSMQIKFRLSGRHSLLTGFLLCCLFFLPTVAHANMGLPYAVGQLATEPTGLEGVVITRETLTIDLQKLTDQRLVQVEAIYAIQNEGAARTVDLYFATGVNEVQEFGVWLNDTPIASQLVTDVELPDSWQPPRSTPGLHGEAEVFYPGAELVQGTVPMRFTVQLLPGPQTLNVTYQAAATSNVSANQPTRYWQFSYSLAPARTWTAFGGLDLTILLPPGWNAATTPTLLRDGDHLIGNFSELPADAISITVQAPPGWLYSTILTIGWLTFGIALLGGALLCWRVGLVRGRTTIPGWPIAIGMGLLWGVTVALTGLFLVLAPPATIAASQSGAYGYGTAFAVLGVILLSLLLIVIGFLIAIITLVVVRRRTMQGI